MMILRPVQTTDLDAIMQLATQAGVGMTTLQADLAQLQDKIANALQAFHSDIERPGEEYYFFALEDAKTGRIAGVSAIIAAVGLSRAFFNYKVGTVVHVSPSLNRYKKLQILYLGNDYTGFTEICSLFLSPDYRGHHNGKLLSRARFLFMAEFPRRFAKTVIAELRGVADAEGNAPFWDHLGRLFFDMDFKQADYLSSAANNAMIAELMPKFPIYLCTLPEPARQVVGQVHPDSIPARAMLEADGFRYNGYVDIFDAGAALEVSTKRIHTVRHSKIATITKFATPLSPDRYLISNRSLAGFRASTGRLDFYGDEVYISPDLAQALSVKVGDQIRCALL